MPCSKGLAMKFLNLLPACIIGLISAGFLVMTRELGRTASLFPKILSITILVLTVYYIAEQLYTAYRKPPLPSSGEKTPKEVAGDKPRAARWEIIMASIVIYLGLIYAIGFGVASFFYGAALAYLGGYRKMRVVIPVALVMAVLLVVIGRLFRIPLPTGLLIELF